MTQVCWNAVSIPLSRGLHAIIDADDYPIVSQYKWYAAPSKSGKYYAVTSGRRMKTTGMHQLILGCKAPVIADHIDCAATLDNRRANLRVSDYSGNSINCGIKKTNTSGYRGVSKRGKYWEAGIKLHGKTTYLGWFSTPQEAAIAYNKASADLHGELAFQNIIAAGVKYHED